MRQKAGESQGEDIFGDDTLLRKFEVTRKEWHNHDKEGMGEEDALPTHHASKGRTNPHHQFTTTVSPLEVNPQEPPMAQSR
eukprot:15201955-Ditylum_brightwellii.AAC.1